MALDVTKNFAKVEVSTGYDASATAIVLKTGDGAKLPQPSTDGAFNLVWWDSTNYATPSDDPNKEIVRVTARSTDTLTVTRAQESTAASTKNTGSATYKMILALTKKMVDDIEEAAKKTHVVVYQDVLALDADGVGQFDWTATAIAIYSQPDVPRQITFELIAMGTPGQDCTGTLTINGIDADGATISEVFSGLDSPVGGPSETGTTDHAFAGITSIAKSNLGGNAIGILLIGFNDALGLPNYPFKATTDVFKIKRGAISPGSLVGWTIGITYGTALPGAAITTNDDFTFWYRPFKT